MKLPLSNLSSAPRHQRGVALVVTLILLAVITFLAVAFLFLSQRERASVSVAVDQTTARLAGEAAAERAKAETLARIIATTNEFNYDLRVSTNFFNRLGFNPAPPTPEVVNSTTNVNYDYKTDNTPFTADQRNQNIANLYYSPRPPVFVVTNRATGASDFRYWLDLNRNGLYDTNGLQPELSGNAALPYVDTNGLWTASLAEARFQQYVGDPEWIGLLSHPDLPHGPNNRFRSRFAYYVVPSGKALDINAIHNQSKLPGNPALEGFSRNMGVGPWEMNLASLFVDLNTNYWNPGPTWPNYLYQTNVANQSQGTAFLDALALTRYRYNGNWNNLRSVNQLFGGFGANAFRADMADGYGRGPLMLGNALPAVDPDQFYNNVGFGWPGADNPNRFFTPQDLFNPVKSPPTFVNRLLNAGVQPDSYNRYTYYRLLSQLGTDSAPESDNRMHLNFVNVNAAGKTIPDAQTNYVEWNALQFFTNASDRLLRAEFPSASANRRNFNVNAPLSITNIPVLVSNQFVYTPALHRIFQLAANIYDASTNHTADRGGPNYPFLPSVFRPTFRMQANGSFTDVYINDWVEDVGGSTAYLNKPLDLNDSADRTLLQSATIFNGNIYGVPWAIGAKKGLPNFNEFAMQSIVQISRRLQVRRPSINALPNTTNQMFVVGISNLCAFEAWNSYSSNYSRDVQVIVANDMSIDFRYTNDVPLDLRGGFMTNRLTVANTVNIAPNAWSGHGPRISLPETRSFQGPHQTNFIFLPDAVFRMPLAGAPSFTINTNAGMNIVYGFEQTKVFPQPQLSFAVTNRIRFIMRDVATGRVIDYVQLNDMNGVRDLSSELTTSDTSFHVDGQWGGKEQLFWQTNRASAKLTTPPQGVINQIEAALGNITVADWNSYGQGQADGQSKQKEIDGFRVFMGQAPIYFPGTVNTNTVMQVPFTPTRRTSQYITWQANDPLVHYMVGDMASLAQGRGIRREQPNGVIQPIPNIGHLNDRYEPWGGNPSSAATNTPTVDVYELAAKDPGVFTSDNWDFPTNKFPTVGWLGRVHRGTPWQTVYLKSTQVKDAAWSKWTGNSNANDARLTQPINDRVIFDVFTTAFDQNSTRGQLNVNQTNLAAWSALFGGVIGLTNVSSSGELQVVPPVVRVEPAIINPAGMIPGDGTNAALWKIWDGISRARTNFQHQAFQRAADVLSAPELTVQSPLLDVSSDLQRQKGINDATYERLPQMVMGLLRGNDQPRFTIYAIGQSLHPAPRSIVTSGSFVGLCTNYQITAEFATRTVVRIEGAPTAPRAVVESFNILPPD